MTTPNIEELRGLAKEFEDRGCHIDDIGFNSGSTSVNKLMRRYFEGLIVHAPALLDALEALGREVSELKDRLESSVHGQNQTFDLCKMLEEERDQARAELAAIRAQAESALGYLNTWQKNGGTKAGYEFVDAAIAMLATSPKIGGV